MKNKKFNPINHAPINPVHFSEAIDGLISILPFKITRVLIPIIFFSVMLIFGLVLGFLIYFITHWFTNSILLAIGLFFIFFICSFIYGIFQGVSIYKNITQYQDNDPQKKRV